MLIFVERYLYDQQIYCNAGYATNAEDTKLSLLCTKVIAYMQKKGQFGDCNFPIIDKHSTFERNICKYQALILLPLEIFRKWSKP